MLLTGCALDVEPAGCAADRLRRRQRGAAHRPMRNNAADRPAAMRRCCTPSSAWPTGLSPTAGDQKGEHNDGRKQARTFLLRGTASPLQGLFSQRRAALCLRRRRRRRYSAEPGGCPSAARRRATGPLYPVQKSLAAWYSSSNRGNGRSGCDTYCRLNPAVGPLYR